MSEPKLSFADLQAEAERLIAKEEMPSLQQVLKAVAEIRRKYADKIMAARKESERLSR
jgi:hypothetical protein